MANKKKAEKEIVKVDVAPVEPLGTEFMGASDIQIPTIRLLQSQSDMVMEGNAQAGQWASDTTRFGDWIEFVPIAFIKRRVYFDEDNRASRKCWSDDGEINHEGTPCRTACPFQACSDVREHWSYWQGQGKSSPPCRAVHQWVGMVRDCELSEEVEAMEFEMPVTINFMSTSLSVGKKMAGQIRFRRQHAWTNQIRFAGQRRQNDKGQWFVPVMKQWAKTSDEVLSEHGESFLGIHAAIMEGKAQVQSVAEEANGKPDDDKEMPF